MAYATIAGLPVQAGLYVATVPMLVYALLGSSRPLSVSTTSTLAALTAAAVAGVAGDDPSRALVAASTLAALSGGLLLAAGMLRLGVLADFISAPVLAGFKAGTGLLIAAGQLGTVLGVPRRATASSPRSARPSPTWPDQLADLHAGPGQHRAPARAAALGAAVAAGALLVVGLGILLAVTTGPAGGGLSQTAVNRQAGARTQLAGVATALVVVLTLLFLTPLFEDLPQATLGAVVIVAVTGLVDLAALRRVRQLRVRDFQLALVALAGVLVLGVLPGVLVAVVVSMITLIHGVNYPPIEVLGRRPGSGQWRDLDRHRDGETVPGLLVLRPVAPIYFANGPRVRRRLANLNARPLDMLRRHPEAAAWAPRLFREPDAAAAAFSARPPRGAR